MNTTSHAERWSATSVVPVREESSGRWNPPPSPPPPTLRGIFHVSEFRPPHKDTDFFHQGPMLWTTSWVLFYNDFVYRQGSRWLDFNKCQRLGIWLLNKWHWKILKLIYLKRVFILKPFIPSFWRLQKTEKNNPKIHSNLGQPKTVIATVNLHCE